MKKSTTTKNAPGTPSAKRKPSVDAVDLLVLQQKALLNNIPDIVWLKDKEGRFISVNEPFGKACGVSPEDLIGKTDLDIWPTDLAERYRADDTEVMETGRRKQVEEQLIDKDGNKTWIETIKTPIFNDDGEIIGTTGIARDITARKRSGQALIEQSRHAMLVADIGIALTRGDSLQTVLQKCTEAMVKHLDAYLARIWTVGPEGTTLELQASAGAYTHVDGIDSRIPVGQFKIGMIAKDVKPHLTNAVLEDPLISDREWAKREGIVACAGHPLVVEGNLVGVMGMFAKQELSEATLLSLTSVADEIALGIKHKQAGDSLVREKSRLRALIEVSRGIASILDVKDLYRRIVVISQEIMKFDFSTLMLLSEDKKGLVIQDTVGFPDAMIGSFSLVEGQGLSTYVAANKQFGAVLDFSKETRFAVPPVVLHNNITSALCVPMMVEKGVVGVLIGHTLDERKFTDEEIFLYQSIADQAAVAIEHLRSLQGLRKSEEELKLFRTLIDQSNDPILVGDAQTGQILDGNDKANESLGYTREEFLALRFPDFAVNIPDVSSWKKRVQDIIAHGSFYSENSYRHKDGGTHPVEINAKYITHQGREYIVAVARDVSERKRMEREREKLVNDLRVMIDSVSRSQKEWRDTFDSIQEPIYIVDADYHITKANQAFIDFVGMDFQEVLGKKCYELMHGTTQPALHCPHPSLQEARMPAEVEVVDVQRKRTLVVSHFPYSTPEGAYGGFISIVRDVTDEREKEMRLIMSERLASLGQMAASIAHEINNPLAAILGCAEALQIRVTKGRYDPVLFNNYLAIIQEEVLRCKNITTGMLSISKKASYEKRTMDLNDTLQKTLDLLGYQGRLKDIQVVRLFSTSLPPFHGSEGDLKQIFLSVITNALDAMDDRGTLTVETREEGGALLVAISDTGPGISGEHLNRIFDPFFTTKSDRGGTGLGLSIARKILANHGGEITVFSEQGKGAVFTITLSQE